MPYLASCAWISYPLQAGMTNPTAAQLLDIYRVEQRLKYFGYAAMAANTINTVNEFKVDGQFKAEETAALKFFEKVVRYTSATATGTHTTNNGVTVEIQYRASVTETQDTPKLEEVAGSFKVTAAPTNLSSAALAAAIDTAKREATSRAKAAALTAAGFSGATDVNGIDGKIEADTKNAQHKTTLNWLNAYNAPHWMQFGDVFTQGTKLMGWVNRPSTATASTMGTSWIYDLMVASQNAAKAQNRSTPLWFAGTGGLGVQLNLGINTTYVSQQNQVRVDGKDIVLGLLPASTATPQWDYANAQTLAARLLNPNTANTTGTTPTNTSGQNRQNQALLDFLTVFAATQGNSNNQNNGYWATNTITNANADVIRNALFGDGSQAGGLINSSNVLIGGAAPAFGDELSAESLARFMGRRPAAVNDYVLWVEPLKKAMAEFNINTPQRIAAFLAQIRVESGSLTNTRESFIYTNPAGAARFRAFGSTAAATTYYQTVLRRPGQSLTWYTSASNWRLDQQEQFANYVYGPNSAKGRELGNTQVGDGWLFRGHGLKQTTGRTNTQAFANYVDAHVIAGQPTGAQIMADPDLLSSNFDLAARSAGLYWSQRVTNTRVDALDEGNSTPPNIYYTGPNDPVHYLTPTPQHNKINYGSGNPYTDNITLNVGQDVASYTSRWQFWRDNIASRADGNTFESLRSVMGGVGIQTSSAAGYQSQFGINLKIPRTPLAIGEGTHNLAADTVGALTQSGNTTNLDSFSDTMQVLLSEAKQALNFKQGDYNMFIADLPVQTNSMPAVVLIAKADVTQAQRTHVLGVCELAKVNIEAPGSGFVGLSPVLYANAYYFNVKNSKNDKIDIATAKVSILKSPKHGRLESNANVDPQHPTYIPAKGYEGNDAFVLQVEGNGETVQLRYFVYVSEDAGAEMFSNKNCKGIAWKISQDSSTPNTSADNLAAWLRASDLSTLLAIASQTLTGFADLPGSAVGNTVGEGANAQITLDPTASGHGWYIDPTPLDNTDDYLPTSNPNVWQAKAGSAAEGKMDMLSVLLHEYGHALGLEHSADARDFMATTLQPGERRLPSSEELALMGQLVAQLKAQSSATDSSASNTPGAPASPNSPLPGMPFAGLGLLALGRLRGDRYGTQTQFGPSAQSAGSVLANVAPTAPTARYAVAANATLTNGQFSTANSWATQGSVSIAAGAATLAETATQQTRLNQVFTVGPQDHYLSFTLSGIALDNAAAGAQAQQGPSDAFEVALLNANTGASVAGAMGLTHTDALLNLQAGGAELAASGVSYVTNQDGSRTYVVDLAGVNTNGAAGTAVNLSFDLIGFGSTAPHLGSHATVSNVRLLSTQLAPQTQDDSATLAEDTEAQIVVLANDADAKQVGMAPVVVSGPSHGQVVVNADGSFGYTPHANFFGTDSFSYQVIQDGNASGNGGVQSNVSTVSITVTPVNDAPTLADQNLTVAEDTPLNGNLLASAADIDSAVLTTAIVTGPTHGVLTLNANGTFTCT